MTCLDLGTYVGPLSFRSAREVVVANHYLHRAPPISHAFGWEVGGEVVGVCTFGVPASPHLVRGVCPQDPSLVIELNRVWLSDALPSNSESWFVARALWSLPPHIVVSYADTAKGHVGVIYRALNFHYAGWTDMDRRTPRFDYIPMDPTRHTRDASRSGVSARVRRLPKVRYWTTTGTKTERKALSRLCQWPSLDWRETPPPIQGGTA